VKAPAVSQVVLAYNQEPFVEQCLDSVAQQTFDDFELVIVDDCSTDRTVERIEAWLRNASLDARLVVNERNLGACASHNVALRHCRGTFISSVSADDFYEPDKIEREYEFWGELDESVAVVFCNVRWVDEQGREIRLAYRPGHRPPDGRVFDRLIEGNFIFSPAVMARRTALEEVGGYDESLFYEDYDMWLKLADRYEFRYLPGSLANYRILGYSHSRSPAHAAAMHEARATLLLKWYGRDRHTDRVIIRRAWKNGRRVLAADRARGRRLLQKICATRPTLRHRAGVAASSVPGVGHVLAGAFALADGLRSR
jgi:glycosyltransferase involved in cell wall biosynthesis